MPENRSRFAILGALTVAPMSGYGLRQFFSQSVSFFWRESFGQIYPILKELQREGLIRPAARQPATSGTTYVITKAGRAELARWLDQPAELQPPRVELLLKLFFAREGSPASALRLIQDFRRNHREKLVVYEGLGRRLRNEHAANPNLPFWLMTISYGEHLTRAMLAWCDAAERKLGRGK
jgi:PadR family transcriptional regulator AphA